MKTCKKCDKQLPFSRFRIRTQNGYTFYRSDCKTCENVRIRASRSSRGLFYNQKQGFKVQARHALNQQVRSGKIVKPTTCSKCGVVGDLQGHHSDYSNKLEVTWLCASCHQNEHTLLLAPVRDDANSEGYDRSKNETDTLTEKRESAQETSSSTDTSLNG